MRKIQGAAKKGQKLIIITIQVNLCCFLHISLGIDTRIVVIKKLPLVYNHSHFLASPFDFTYFFTTNLLHLPSFTYICTVAKSWHISFSIQHQTLNQLVYLKMKSASIKSTETRNDGITRIPQ